MLLFQFVILKFEPNETRLMCTIRSFYGMAINKFEKLRAKRQFLTTLLFLSSLLLKKKTHQKIIKRSVEKNIVKFLKKLKKNPVLSKISIKKNI